GLPSLAILKRRRGLWTGIGAADSRRAGWNYERCGKGRRQGNDEDLKPPSMSSPAMAGCGLLSLLGPSGRIGVGWSKVFAAPIVGLVRSLNAISLRHLNSIPAWSHPRGRLLFEARPLGATAK